MSNNVQVLSQKECRYKATFFHDLKVARNEQKL